MFSKLLAFLKGVPLIHDVHISKLLTYYNVYGLKNRKRFIPKILYYLYFYVLEFLLCHLSDFVVLDTASHIKYFRETFKIPLKKFRKIYVGSREDYFYPIECEKSDNHNILVGFWGSFIQASGVNYIIKAIASLKEQKNLSLLLLGGGITYEKDKELVKRLNLKNVKFLDFVPVKEVAKIIANCDIGLGIFGAFFKVDLVIPNKLFDGMAMKIPMISAESAAVRELFTEGKDIILCDPGNSKSLADAILKLINNKRLRYEISENAYRLFKKYCTTNKIGERLIKILLEKIDK
ncbi:MAG: glycosyltransferase [Promethearchaeota archaeon]